MTRPRTSLLMSGREIGWAVERSDGWLGDRMVGSADRSTDRPKCHASGLVTTSYEASDSRVGRRAPELPILFLL